LIVVIRKMLLLR